MDQKEFLEKVHGLLALAKDRGGSITEEMLELPFAGENLNADQILSLRSYLKANGVSITEDGETVESAEDADFVEGADLAEAVDQTGDADSIKMTKLSKNPFAEEPRTEVSGKVIKMTAAKDASRMANKEKKIYQSYLEELKQITGYLPQEEPALLERKNMGDAAARMLLIEGNLKKVVKLAGRYAGRGVPLPDLVQEGNMELLLFVDAYTGGEFQKKMEQSLSKAMERLIEENSDQDAFKNRMADMANRLLDASAEFADDMGEQPTVEELARQLNISPEEVETVMKMSMDSMTMDETGLGGE